MRKRPLFFLIIYVTGACQHRNTILSLPERFIIAYTQSGVVMCPGYVVNILDVDFVGNLCVNAIEKCSPGPSIYVLYCNLAQVINYR